jgi:hypothetical protein
MSENLTNEQILNTFANKMLSAVEGIEAFGKEQIPDYIEQILVYNFWDSLISSALPIIICVFIITTFFLISKKTKWDEKDDTGKTEFHLFGGFIVVFLIVLLSGCFIIPNARKALKIKLAPKVYIVDYLRNNI